VEREHLIDALRGFALFGILVVNIQSFAWGVGAPTMGVLWLDATWRDEWTIWLTSFIFEFKIYPLFCFCFGYGFAMMAKNWRHQGLDLEAIRQRFTRRINFMLWLGLFHGVFIWFGDILARYALAAYLLDKHIGKGPRGLLKPLKFWGMVTIVISVFSVVLNTLLANKIGTESTQPTALMIDAFYVYAQGDYFDTIIARLGDYSLVMFSWLFLFPQVIFLFIAGAIVAQLGWLKSPAQHRQKLQRILSASLTIGLPFAIIIANYNLAAANNPSLLPNAIENIALTLSLLLTPAYIAVFALISTTAFGKKIIALLAPLGRMALTNYLLQSLAMFVLLLGVGFSLADVGQFNIALIAIGIYLTQLLASHVYFRFRRVGPMESLWRRYTYVS
jgi:uncharacterized protein